MTLFALLVACSGGSSPSTSSPDAAPLVVYSGRSEALVGPLMERIEAKLGFPIEVQYGKTDELVARLLTEGDQSPAHVVFAQDSGSLGLLASRGALAKLPEDLLAEVEPSFRDPEGRWVGSSGRLRVMVVDTEQVPASKTPKRLADLADPAWKGMLGWAPQNASFQAHVSALRHMWGEDETRTWLAAVKANEARAYPKNSPQVKAANEGAIAIGWVNHYYLHREAAEGRRAANRSFVAGDAGNVMMVSGAGLREGAGNQQRALAFLRALVDADAQTYFATESFEYPTRPGVALHPEVAPLPEGLLADIRQEHLADLGPTRAMLQELGLL